MSLTAFESIERRTRMLYSLSFIAMAVANLSSIGSFSIFFLFPLFISEHGGTHADTGIIMGVFTLSSVLCRPWISEMIDRIGRKKSYTIGITIMVILPFFYISFHGNLSTFYLPLLLTRVVHGVGIAICTTAAFTYASDIIPRDRLNEGIGMFGISGLAGMAIGPMVAEFALKHFGFEAFFLSAAGLALVGLLIHLPLRESYSNASREERESFFVVFRKKRISAIALLALLFGFGLAGANNFISPYAHQRHLTLISLYYGSYSAAAILTRLIGGRFIDRIGEGRILPYALTLTGGGLLTLTFLQGNAILLLSGLMTGWGHGLLYPSLNALAIRNEPGGIRGKITGIYTGGIDAGVFIGSIVLGYVGEWAGFPTLFFGAGSVLLVGLLIYRHALR